MKPREWVFCRGVVLLLAAVLGIGAGAGAAEAEADASVTLGSGDFVLDGGFASVYGLLVSGHGLTDMRERARTMDANLLVLRVDRSTTPVAAAAAAGRVR
jgi:hypothetical protein